MLRVDVRKQMIFRGVLGRMYESQGGRDSVQTGHQRALWMIGSQAGKSKPRCECTQDEWNTVESNTLQNKSISCCRCLYIL